MRVCVCVFESMYVSERVCVCVGVFVQMLLVWGWVERVHVRVCIERGVCVCACVCV